MKIVRRIFIVILMLTMLLPTLPVSATKVHATPNYETSVISFDSSDVWQQFTFGEVPIEKIYTLKNGEVFAEGLFGSLYALNGKTLKKVIDGTINDVAVSDNYIYVSARDRLYCMSNPNDLSVFYTGNINKLAVSSNDILYYYNKDYDLVKVSIDTVYGSLTSTIVDNHFNRYFNSLYTMTFYNNELWYVVGNELYSSVNRRNNDYAFTSKHSFPLPIENVFYTSQGIFVYCSNYSSGAFYKVGVDKPIFIGGDLYVSEVVLFNDKMYLLVNNMLYTYENDSLVKCDLYSGDLFDITATNDKLYACSYDGLLEKEGELTRIYCNTVPSEVESAIMDITYCRDNIYVLNGSNNKIYRSEDKGESWFLMDTPFEPRLLLTADDELYCYANDSLYKWTDNKWTAYSMTTEDGESINIDTIANFYVSDNTIYMEANNNFYVKTQDSWRFLCTFFWKNIFTERLFAIRDEVPYVCYNERVYRFVNDAWHDLPYHDSDSIERIEFYNGELYLTTQYRLYRFDEEMQTWVVVALYGKNLKVLDMYVTPYNNLIIYNNTEIYYMIEPMGDLFYTNTPWYGYDSFVRCFDNKLFFVSNSGIYNAYIYMSNEDFNVTQVAGENLLEIYCPDGYEYCVLQDMNLLYWKSGNGAITVNLGETYIICFRKADALSSYVSLPIASRTITPAKFNAQGTPTLTVKSVQTTSIIFETIPNAEYSKDGGITWQTGFAFYGLTPDTDYTFVARYLETDTTLASEACAPMQVKTLPLVTQEKKNQPPFIIGGIVAVNVAIVAFFLIKGKKNKEKAQPKQVVSDWDTPIQIHISDDD